MTPELVSVDSRSRDQIADIVVLTHPGQVRKDNQDRVGRVAHPDAQLAVVADGVGGAAGGARAAEFAVQGYLQLLAPQKECPALYEAPTEALQRATQNIQQQIAGTRETDLALSNMASTVVVAYLRDTVATVGHLGDARAYLFRAAQLQRLTRDHSVVQRMVQDGLLSEAEALRHPQGHILTHSLGQPQMQLEITSLPMDEGDLFLLCSDGLWASVSDEELARELADTGPELATTARRLLDCALQAGAPDNVSVALIRVLPLRIASESLDPGARLHGSQGPSTTIRLRFIFFASILLALACALVWWSLHSTLGGNAKP